MPKLLALLVCVCVGLSVPAGAGMLDNEAFCKSVLDESCDSLLKQLPLPAEGGLILSRSDGRYGDLLHERLVENMHERGLTLYLSDSSEGDMPSLETSLERMELTYRGIGSGLFSRGQVERSCVVSVSANLLAPDGRLLGVAGLSSLKRTELLEFDDAALARGDDALYAPAMPPSAFQRIVEPALILSITGALVYLFFASR